MAIVPSSLTSYTLSVLLTQLEIVHLIYDLLNVTYEHFK